jgi:carboxyl-terminal processing protease
MPRRNVYLLLAVIAVSIVCYLKADAEHRNRYGTMFNTFVTAMGEIREKHLYETDERKLFEGAMHGMVDQLDPYSGYAGEDETREFRESLNQEFGGIGIEVSWDEKTKSLMVLSPIVGTPAYEKGMMSGDRILKINDESTEGFTLHDAVKRLRGKPGEPVRIAVAREGEEQARELEIVRATINVDTVLGDRRRADGSWNYVLEQAPEFGYVRITQFGEKTADELKRALEQLRGANIRGLIIDLRNDPGGLLTAATTICDQFVKQGTIVSVRDREGRDREKYLATGDAQYTDWPLVVLVNHFSASASEIVAACLQDHGQAIVVGERTWGKGTVQTPIHLEDGKSMLRLTIAGFWRPNGKNIHRDPKKSTDKDTWGVSPDTGYEVKLDDKQAIEIAKQRRARDVLPRGGDAAPAAPKIDDPMVDKAVEYLLKETGLAVPPAAKAA